MSIATGTERAELSGGVLQIISKSWVEEVMESGQGVVRCLIGKHTRRKSFEPAVDIQVMPWMCDDTGRRDWLLFACANAEKTGSREQESCNTETRRGVAGSWQAA